MIAPSIFGPASDFSAIEKTDLTVGSQLAAWRELPVIRWCCNIGEIGDQGPLYLTGSAAVLVGYLTRKPRILKLGLSALTAVLIADASKRWVKKLVTRSRPHQLLDHGEYARAGGGSEEKHEQSFPSGHVAGSIAVARALSRDFPQASKAAMAGAAVIGFTRLLKGAHWPADVAAGIAVGWLAEVLSRRVARQIDGLTHQLLQMR